MRGKNIWARCKAQIRTYYWVEPVKDPSHTLFLFLRVCRQLGGEMESQRMRGIEGKIGVWGGCVGNENACGGEGESDVGSREACAWKSWVNGEDKLNHGEKTHGRLKKDSCESRKNLTKSPHSSYIFLTSHPPKSLSQLS